MASSIASASPRLSHAVATARRSRSGRGDLRIAARTATPHPSGPSAPSARTCQPPGGVQDRLRRDEHPGRARVNRTTTSAPSRRAGEHEQPAGLRRVGHEGGPAVQPQPAAGAVQPERHAVGVPVGSAGDAPSASTAPGYRVARRGRRSSASRSGAGASKHSAPPSTVDPRYGLSAAARPISCSDHRHLGERGSPAVQAFRHLQAEPAGRREQARQPVNRRRPRIAEQLARDLAAARPRHSSQLIIGHLSLMPLAPWAARARARR